MAAPYLINNESITKGIVRNVESESGSSIVWKRGNVYTFEQYDENLEYDVDVPTLTMSQDSYWSITPVDGSTYKMLFHDTSSKDPFLENTLWFNQITQDPPGNFIILATLSNIESSAELAVEDFFEGVSTNGFGSVTELVDGFKFSGRGRWRQNNGIVQPNADTGEGFMHFQKTSASVINGNPTGSTLVTPTTSGFADTVRFQIVESGWVEPTADNFPPLRPNDYDPDGHWDPKTETWTDPWDLTTLGGGRYNQQLVALGHRKIYFQELD